MAVDDDVPLIQALNRAFAALHEVRAEAGAISLMPCPEGALEALLSANRDYKTAKGKTKAAVERLRPICPPEVWLHVLRFESAIRAEQAVMADLAFAIGMSGSGTGR